MKNKSIILFSTILIVSGVVGFAAFSFINNQDSTKELEQQSVNNRLVVLEEIVEEFQLERLSEANGLEGLNETYEYVEIEEGKNTQSDLTDDQISNYQTYVTPNSSAVIELAKGNSYEQIYQEALSWTWVQDDIINGVSEKWLYPEVFLTQTPNFETNPVPGRIASDCESQAYTLVSALRAAGMSADKVRVVTGLVNFGGSTGGHAWVEVYDDELEGWFALEATSGNYYDSATGELIESNGLAYNYFKVYRYPSVQIWNYFNDKYFYDLGLNEGNAPEIWLNQESVSQAPSIDEIKYEVPDYLKERRNQARENIQKIQNEVQEKVEETSKEEIEQEILSIITQTEALVEEGLTDAERQAIVDQLKVAIDEVTVLIDESSLPPAQKATLNGYLSIIEGYVDTGLTQLQWKAIQSQILNGLNELEEKIANN